MGIHELVGQWDSGKVEKWESETVRRSEDRREISVLPMYVQPPFDNSAAAMVQYTHIHMKLFPVTGWGAKRVYSCCRWIWRKPLKGRNKPSFFYRRLYHEH